MDKTVLAFIVFFLLSGVEQNLYSIFLFLTYIYIKINLIWIEKNL